MSWIIGWLFFPLCQDSNILLNNKYLIAITWQQIQLYFLQLAVWRLVMNCSVESKLVGLLQLQYFAPWGVYWHLILDPVPIICFLVI